MGTTDGEPAIAAVADAISAERRQAETLLYRLTTAKLLLGAGDALLLPQALAEVELATAGLESAGTRRAAAVGALAASWQRDPDSLTLPRLLAAAGPPWSTELTEHLRALRHVTARIATTAATDRALAAAALDFVRRRLAPTPRRLEPVGVGRELELAEELDMAAALTELRVQEVTYETVIDAAEASVPRDLLRFLGVSSQAAPVTSLSGR